MASFCLKTSATLSAVFFIIPSAFFKCLTAHITGANQIVANEISSIHHAHLQLSTAAVQSLTSAAVHTPGNSQPTICHTVVATLSHSA